MLTTAKTLRRFMFNRTLGLVIALVCTVSLLSNPAPVMADEQSDDSGGVLSVVLEPALPAVEFIPIDFSDYPTLQPIEATTTYSTLNYVNSSVSGLYVSSQTYSGSSTVVSGGQHVIDTLGTGTVLTSGVSPTVGGLVFSGNMTASGSGAMTLLQTPPATLNLSSSDSYITGVTISMYINTPVNLVSYTGDWTLPADYKGDASGTFTLTGSNSITLGSATSFDSIDGSIPEPATGLMLFLAAIAFFPQRNCFLRQG